MIWYILGGIVGIFYYREKYNLSFWSAVWHGIVLTLGVYFFIGLVTAIFTVLAGLEEPNPTLIYAIVYAVAVFGSYSILKRLQVNDVSIVEIDQKMDPVMVDDTYSGTVEGYQPEPGDTIETALAGVMFEDRQNVLRQLTPGQSVILEREPENIHDSNAIKVLNSTEDNRVIGYIHKELAAKIAWIIDEYQTEPIIGYVSSIYVQKNDPSSIGVKINFDLPDSYEYEDQLEEN